MLKIRELSSLLLNLKRGNRDQHVLCFPIPCFEEGQQFEKAALHDDPGSKVESSVFGMVPNPANGQVTFTYHLGAANHQVILTTLDGKVVDKLKDISGDKQVVYDTSQLPPGIYFVQVTNDLRRVAVEKLVIVH